MSFKKPSLSLSDRVFDLLNNVDMGLSAAAVAEPNLYTLAPGIVANRSATCPSKGSSAVCGLLAPLGGASRRPCQASALLTSGVGNSSEPALMGNDYRVLAATRRRHPAESYNAAALLSGPWGKNRSVFR